MLKAKALAVVVMLTLLVAAAYCQNLVCEINPQPTATPLAPPLVFSEHMAVMTYSHPNGTVEIAVVSPCDKGREVRSVSVVGAYDQMPIALSDRAALVYSSSREESHFMVITNETAFSVFDRRGSMANVVLSAENQVVVVPIGDPRSVEAYNVSDVASGAYSNADVRMWSFAFPKGDVLANDVVEGTPVVEGDYVYALDSNVLFKLKVLTGELVMDSPWPLLHPCGFTSTGPLFMHLVTYGWRFDEPLNALLLFGNTTAIGERTTAICRVHQETGEAMWVRRLGGDYTFEFVTGGENALFLSASTLNKLSAGTLREYSLLAIDPMSGETLWNIPRHMRDRSSAPSPFTMPPVGVSGVAFQVNGQLMAHSSINHDTLWVSLEPCFAPPLFLSEQRLIACVGAMDGLHTVDTKSGRLVWKEGGVQTIWTPTYLASRQLLAVVSSDNTLMVFEVGRRDFDDDSPKHKMTWIEGSVLGMSIIIVVTLGCIYLTVRIRKNRQQLSEQMEALRLQPMGPVTSTSSVTSSAQLAESRKPPPPSETARLIAAH